MLTARQKECFDFIVKYMRDSGGVSPALSDIAGALGGIGKGHVHHLLNQLEARGLIRRMKFRARAIEVLAEPDKPAPARIPIYRAGDNKLMDYLP